MAALALWKLLSSCPTLDFLKCQVIMGLGGALQSVSHTAKVGSRIWFKPLVQARCLAASACAVPGMLSRLLGVQSCNTWHAASGQLLALLQPTAVQPVRNLGLRNLAVRFRVIARMRLEGGMQLKGVKAHTSLG